jgi:pyruvate-formate lyase-activating enzyme
MSAFTPLPAMAQAEESHLTKGLVRLTMVCNERCPFCNVPAEDYPTAPTPEAVIDGQIAALLAEGGRTLTISGGEPTLLRRRLLDTVRRARAAGVPLVELQTNAILLTPDYAAALAEAGLTSAFVSLLSHVPEHHDALAGLDGAFPRCLLGLDALLAAGVRVTLNPVLASPTQTLLPDYLRFVAARLPGVKSVSVSAVQPHGRAREHLHLLPDYALLGPAVKEAQAVAAGLGIELLNPYCGLPLCVGWAEAQDRSVEALEAEVGGARALNIQNEHNKRQGAPCRRCALRTRCGGAWVEYWSERGGSGLQAPLRSAPPWSPEAADPGAQGVSDALDALGAEDAPTRWWSVRSLAPGDSARLLGSAATDLAVRLDPQDRATLVELRRLQRAQAGAAPQLRRRVWLLLDARGHSEAQVLDLARLAAALDAHGLTLTGADPRLRRALGLALPSLHLELLP